MQRRLFHVRQFEGKPMGDRTEENDEEVAVGRIVGRHDGG